MTEISAVQVTENVTSKLYPGSMYNTFTPKSLNATSAPQSLVKQGQALFTVVSPCIVQTLTLEPLEVERETFKNDHKQLICHLKRKKRRRKGRQTN